MLLSCDNGDKRALLVVGVVGVVDDETSAVGTKADTVVVVVATSRAAKIRALLGIGIVVQ